jgi:hypothetical protein
LPLPAASSSTRNRSLQTAAVALDHSIFVDNNGLITIIGGM